MTDPNALLTALDRHRTEQREDNAELRDEMRSGFQRMEDKLSNGHGRLERHSERIKALARKVGTGSDGYPTQHPPRPGTQPDMPALVPIPAPTALAPWWRPYAVAGGSAVAGMLATKLAPKVMGFLAEVLK